MDNKFTECINLDDWNVLSDQGYINVKKVLKTVPYVVFEIKTTNYSLKCADKHILFDENYNEIYVKNLKIGDKIQTESGVEEILDIVNTGIKKEMYDLDINDTSHRYYTNGILSHNTTTVTCFLLHYILFNFDKKIAVLANKGSMAREILSRIQLAYINLPKWIQSGIKSWNKGSIELENGCSIIAAATSSDSVRGSSFSCVTGDTKIWIKDNNKIYETTISKLENKQTNNLKVLTNSGYKSFNGLRITYTNDLIHIIFNNNSQLKCTLEHKLLCLDNNYKEVKDLTTNDILQDLLGNPIKIVNIQHIKYNNIKVYDLINVEDTHSYYTNGVISHNCIFIDECIGGSSMITIRNKKTGKIEKITMEDFYNKINI